jgi:hypothetical protein
MPFILENVASGPQNHPSASTAHSWFRDNGTGGVAEEEEAEVAPTMVLPPRVLFSLEDEREKKADDDGKKLFIVVEDIVCLFFFLYVYNPRGVRFARGCRSEVRFLGDDDVSQIEKIYEREMRVCARLQRSRSSSLLSLSF